MARKKKEESKTLASPDTKEAKSNQVDLAIAALEKQFGKGSIRNGVDDEKVVDVPRTSTQCLSVDKALGGGLPVGRIIEIYGPESSGKTTLSLHAIAEVQKSGGMAAFIDAEHAIDVNYARNLGVDTSNLLISQPDSGEQALEITETLIRSGAVNLIVVDSVAALVPRKELEGEMGDSHMGLQARLMSQALRKITGIISKSNCTVIFINQLRMKIGVMFGNPETTTGGNALKFYASQRIDIRRTGPYKKGNDLIGNTTRVRVVKNKVAPPFKEAEFNILYGVGIDFYSDLLKMAVETGVVDKNGSWYSYGEDRIGQGEAQVSEFLRSNPELFTEIKEKVQHG